MVHRTALWTTSACPDESTPHYIFLNGRLVIMLAARPGGPLIAWDTFTLDLGCEAVCLKKRAPPRTDQKVHLSVTSYRVLLMCCMTILIFTAFNQGMLKTCTVSRQSNGARKSNMASVKKTALRDALQLLFISAICREDSKQVQKETDADGAGIVTFRIHTMSLLVFIM